MSYDPYSRTNQQMLDGAVVGVSFSLACLISTAGRIPYSGNQFWIMLLALVAGRLVWNYLFGLHRIQWRYVGLHDAFRTGRAYLAFSVLLLIIQLILPASITIGRISPAIITVEFLLSLVGALGVRGLRRYIYEIKSRKADAPQEQLRRVLLIGAGMMGAAVARDM